MQILDVDPFPQSAAVHVDHALDRLGKGFAPHLFGMYRLYFEVNT
jgi:hypothetical protein